MRVRRHCQYRMSIMMAKYKYFVVTVMLLLFIYTLCLDISYPFLETGIFEELEGVHQEVARLKPTAIANASNSTYCDVYNLTSNYKADFECVKTRTKPEATVCIYPRGMDMYISHDIRETGLWEPQIIPDFYEVLNKDPSLGLLDIGANVGYYTMLAAALGRKVLAVEPNLNSIYRIHRAAVITNSTSQITVLHNAISDIRVKGTLFGGGDNKGDVRVHPAARPCSGSCPEVVQMIYLDDILEALPFDRAILKLDIQGMEHKAIHHAKKLLSKIHIPVIFMEWAVMTEHFLSDGETTEDKFLVQDMIRVLFSYNYRPYALSNQGGKPLDSAVWNTWPHDILWRKLANEEEMQGVMLNHFIHWP